MEPTGRENSRPVDKNGTDVKEVNGTPNSAHSNCAQEADSEQGGHEPHHHEDSIQTRMVHAGEDRSQSIRPLTAPIYQTSVLAFDDPANATHRYECDDQLPNYSRDHFPNVVALEAAVADLEGAEAGYATSSGMAAISLVFMSLLSQGDHVIVADGVYCDTQVLLNRVLSRFGIEASFIDLSDLTAVEDAFKDRTRIVFAETIANPSMAVHDLRALAEKAHAHDTTLIVDNTFATPALCRPMEQGADLVVHSATKFLGGHHDLTAGVIVGHEDLIEIVRPTGFLVGAVLGSLDAWLALRGIRTLGPRMAWISSNAVRIGKFLAEHPSVASVSYPGFSGGEEGEVANRMLPTGAGGMMMFEVHGGADTANAVVRALNLIQFAPSLGGTETTICFPPFSRLGITDAQQMGGRLRLSIGLESADDLMADLHQALTGGRPQSTVHVRETAEQGVS